MSCCTKFTPSVHSNPATVREAGCVLVPGVIGGIIGYYTLETWAYSVEPKHARPLAAVVGASLGIGLTQIARRLFFRTEEGAVDGETGVV